jgi:hypothetical protein
MDTEDTQSSTDSDRRQDIEAKQARVAGLLKDKGCEGLLLLEPENIAWLSSGGVDRGRPDPGTSPGIWCNSDQRWLLCSNVDSQRYFDEELDSLGFQLKEWPWHWGRDQLLAELCQNRKVACDRALPDTVLVQDELSWMRRTLTVYEQVCFQVLGQYLVHSLEATCRSIAVNDTEREAAGQISHRLAHRGVQALHIGVAADGRSRLYRNPGFTSVPITRYALMTATARKYGLVATASRAVYFGTPEEELHKEQIAVCRVSASYLASTWPEALPRQIITAGQRIYQVSGYEHEWRMAPQGWVTARAFAEVPLSPLSEEVFQANWAVTWQVTAGAASSCDTFLITDQGPQPLTPVEVWPVMKIKIQGAEFIRPDILRR